MSSGGQILGGVAGAIIGFFAGGGNVFLGAQIGMLAGGALDPPKGPTINGPRLTDLTVQGSTYGAVIPRAYGTVTVTGNLIWLENNRLKETVTKKKSGGKGGGAVSTTRTYTYSATFAVGLCKGPIFGVRRIWVGADLIYDAGSQERDAIIASNRAAEGFAIYTGTDIQEPDPRLQATLGIANTPAWRGLAYIVFYDLPLARYSNSLLGAQVRVEVVSTGSFIPHVNTGNVPTAGGQYQWKPGFADWGGVAISPWPAPTSTYLYTTDGLTWSTRQFPMSGFWKCVYGNGSKMCAVSFSPPRALMSADGAQWSVVTIPYRGYGGITYNGSVWCIAAIGYASISADDGATWAEVALPEAISDVLSCLSHNGRIIICDHSHTEYFTSDDNGVSFQKKTFPFGINMGLAGAATNGDRIVGIVGVMQSQCSISTDDGNTWSTPVEIAAGFSGWNDICYGRGVFLASKGNVFAYSVDDGVTWNAVVVNHANGAGYSWKTTVFNGESFSTVPTSGTSCYTVGFHVLSETDTLAAVVGTECKLAGLAQSDINASALTSSIHGYRVSTVGAIRGALEPLQAVWPFDLRQHGYVVQFIPRGGASVATIPEDDLDARPAGQPAGVRITTAREIDAQLPRRVTVRHLDRDREYDTGAQYAERLNSSAVNEQVIDLAVVLTATEAARVAEVLLYLYWRERYDVAFTLPPTYAHLEPGDTITLESAAAGSMRLRLTSVHYTSESTLECTARYADAAIYSSSAAGGGSAVTGSGTVRPIVATSYVLLDLPTVSSKQSGPSFLVAMSGASGWPGGVLMQSTDAGGTWEVLRDFSAPGATLGACENALVAVEPRLVDHTGVLTVNLRQGALYSVSRLAMLGGANACAYGAPGRWEILAAQTITPLGGTRYALQDMLRGLAGTEWAMGLHAPGDTLLLLDPADVAVIEAATADIGRPYLYRGITLGRDIGTDTDRQFTYHGVNLKPLSPIALNGSRHPTTGDWSLTWVRRTRAGGEWRDFVDAALSESSEQYIVDIYADAGYTTVKRRITASTPACAYSSALQVADFGANQATLYLKLYQVSADVGLGYPLTTTITR
jgi:hypothetical protein